MSAVIGFIGMGLMGTPMSQRLVKVGHEVWVWNRSPEKMDAVVAAGARGAGSISELMAHADIIMTCLTDTQAVRAVILGEGGVAENGSADKLLIDFSSIDPAATREMASQLQALCGMPWIDAPVSGGVAGAEAGTLAIMAGGEATTIDSVRPLLGYLSQRVTRMGPVGSGQVTKICNQMLVSCNVLVMAEALALAERAGVDTTQIPPALKGGFADSIPLQLTGSRMASGDFEEVKWHVKTLLKDLNMAAGLADAMGSDTPMATLGVDLMERYSQQGLDEKDPANLIKCYQEKQGSD